MTFRLLLSRCMTAMGGQTFCNVAAIKRENPEIFSSFAADTTLNRKSESRRNVNKQTKTYKKYVIFQKELSL